MDRIRQDAVFTSFAAGGVRALSTRISGQDVEVSAGGSVLGRLSLARGQGAATLRQPQPAEGEGLTPLMAALETLFATDRTLTAVGLDLDPRGRLHRACLQSGLAVENSTGGLCVPAGMFWQRPEPWLARPAGPPYPQQHVMTGKVRHPRRPPKGNGTLYARFIPWLGQVLSFRAFDPAIDLERFNRWMNDPRVAQIWDEAGDLAAHAAYAQKLAADPHMQAVIACLDETPFGYFELYWARENRLGPYYDAADHDRGWHVLIGEESCRGKAFVTAWLPSLMHFMFLDEPRTQRIVGEPAAHHAQQLKNLTRSGFAAVKHVAFPHKKAMLVMLSRERFVDDMLWHPAAAEGA